MKLFAKKSPAERRAVLADQLSAAESEAQATRDESLRLALAGSDTSPADESGWKLAARVQTLAAALAQLDKEIAEAEAASIRAKLEADRRKAAGYCNDLAARADAEFAAHEQWLLGGMASVMNAYRVASGHFPADFADANSHARINLNDLQVAAQQLREKAEHILIGRGDDLMRLVLSSFK